MWPWTRKKYERRGGIRVPAVIDAGLAVMDASTRAALTSERPAQVLDFSQGGCRVAVASLAVGGFELDMCREFPLDYMLELRLSPPGGGAWLVGATLLWIRPENENIDPAYQLGIKFEEPVTLPQAFQRLISKSPAKAGDKAAHITAGAVS